MGLTFFDPRTGAPREFRPAAPPAVGLDAADLGPRGKILAEAVADALEFLGLRTRPGSDLRVGGADPGPNSAWLTAAPVVGQALGPAALAALGFLPEDFRFLCLKVHYRRPLALSREALAAARAELAELRAHERALSGVSLEPSSRGRAGYLHRFREALSKDLDLPAALATVWDGLRPGALSPGSRAALVRETFPALGLARPSAGPK